MQLPQNEVWRGIRRLEQFEDITHPRFSSKFWPTCAAKEKYGVRESSAKEIFFGEDDVFQMKEFRTTLTCWSPNMEVWFRWFSLKQAVVILRNQPLIVRGVMFKLRMYHPGNDHISHHIGKNHQLKSKFEKGTFLASRRVGALGSVSLV